MKATLARGDFLEISETTIKLIIGETGGEDYLEDRRREEEGKKRAILSIRNGEKEISGL